MLSSPKISSVHNLSRLNQVSKESEAKGSAIALKSQIFPKSDSVPKTGGILYGECMQLRSPVCVTCTFILPCQWLTYMNTNTNKSGANGNSLLMTPLGHRYRHGHSSPLGCDFKVRPASLQPIHHLAQE
jgi:hypothetical protein